MQRRYKASTMTVPAYQRQGYSQSGNRLIVCPQIRHRNRLTQMTIQDSFVSPRTCREYMPWPTICNTPVAAFQAGWPQKKQCLRRRSSRDGASALRAQSCSTVTAKLCRMTIVFFGGWRFGLDPAKERPFPPPFSFQQVNYPNQIVWESASAYAAQSGRIRQCEDSRFPRTGIMRNGFLPLDQCAA
jgi:hypothetical protein